MNLTQWALIDIETNGSSAKRDGITEIAIRLIDNWNIVKTWQTLVRPERQIPYQVEELTGITNEMVAKAKPFSEIASDVYDNLSGKLFVAHNARFDYAFIKNAFLNLGIVFSEKVLCTVKLSRTLYPQFKRHNMDSLIDRFGLETHTRHRALADLELMHQFIIQCKNDFGVEAVNNEIKILVKRSSLPSYLSTSVDDIPDTAGVYLLYGETSSIPIYIGKSVNLKARVLSHFSADYTSGKELKLSQQVRHVEWIETAGELGALLLESKLIKEKMPIYNQRLRRIKHVASFQVQESNGYKKIKVVRTNEAKPLNDHYGCFKSKRAAEQALQQLVQDYKLCPKLCGLDKSRSPCFNYQLKKCQGACIQEESSKHYNLKIELALTQYKIQEWPFKGMIGIKEYCKKNQLTQIHLFDQWHHMGSVTNASDVGAFIESSPSVDTTVDDIKIVQSYLKRSNHSNIIVFNKDEVTTCD